MTELRAPSGTYDVLPPDSARFAHLNYVFAQLCSRFGYGLLVTPVFEDVEVFKRVGASTDVVRKEMYDFEDKGGRHIALRPELTASAVRAFLQHNPPTPWKVFCSGPNFRYERPQAGRYRQFFQVDAEAIGSNDPDIDVELITLAKDFYDAMNLREVELIITSLGDEQCRPAHRETLRVFLAERIDQLCPEHAQRYEENPLRVLDCKKEQCRVATIDAPLMVDALCDACATHFERVKEGLEAGGLKFTLAPRLVRGLDYYTRTTFEFVAPALEGAQNAVGGGGRYDGLAEALGGRSTPGIGFALGIDRILLALDAQGAPEAHVVSLDAFVIDVVGGASARDVSSALRRAGISTDRAYDNRSMKSQLKSADRSRARWAVIIGEREAADNVVSLRDLRAEGEQLTLTAQQLIEHVRRAKGESS